jgi:hypothetical protein
MAPVTFEKTGFCPISFDSQIDHSKITTPRCWGWQRQEQGPEQDQGQDEGFDGLPELSVIFDSQGK